MPFGSKPKPMGKAKADSAIGSGLDRLLYEKLRESLLGQMPAMSGPFPFGISTPSTPEPAPEPEPLPTEQRTMPVVGFRVWNFLRAFDLDTGWKVRLDSTGITSYAWQSRELMATCESGGLVGSGYALASLLAAGVAAPSHHEVPDQNCGCGFYVLRDLGQVASHVIFSEETIAGLVMGWGHVIQHGQEGWRAQYVRIVALMDAGYSPENTHNAQEAAEAYGVPVLSRDRLKALASEYGDPLPSE